MTSIYELDATGLLCPLPVLKIRKYLQNLKSGDTLRVYTDDPAAIIDIPYFCTESNHKILEDRTDNLPYTYIIKKK